MQYFYRLNASNDETAQQMLTAATKQMTMPRDVAIYIYMWRTSMLDSYFYLLSE